MNRRSSMAAALLAPGPVLGLILVLALGPLAPAAPAQDLASFEKKVPVHVLKNGWTFLILERPEAPVFSFATLADVGSAQEVPGITGLAHMFEHMAFKGTETVGTTDYAAEKKAMDASEAAYQAYLAERLAPRPDKARLEKLLADFRARQAEAVRYVKKNEFSEIIEREGGAGLNAYTSSDETAYFYALPSNKVELFAYLESERFLHPVFREFYEERDVVQEERRLSTDSQPQGRLFEQFTSVAYFAHPYGRPIVGYMSDLESFTRTDAERFFERYYAPANLVTAVVGDVKARELIPLIEKYFGRIPPRPRPEPLRTVEPPQIAEKEVVLKDLSQPVYLEAYHKPASTGPDEPAYAGLTDVLTRGRTSRLYRALVSDKKLAVSAQTVGTYPGPKYPGLWAVYVTPAVGADNEQVRAALRAELERIKSEDITDEELARFKTRQRADLVRGLRSNQGLALGLAENQRLYGDWRHLFTDVARIEKVTKADIRRVAGELFRAENRTVARIETIAPAPAQETTKDAAKEGTR
jgi:predicted Zn-dependent peptidase